MATPAAAAAAVAPPRTKMTANENQAATRAELETSLIARNDKIATLEIDLEIAANELEIERTRLCAVIDKQEIKIWDLQADAEESGLEAEKLSERIHELESALTDCDLQDSMLHADGTIITESSVGGVVDVERSSDRHSGAHATLRAEIAFRNERIRELEDRIERSEAARLHDVAREEALGQLVERQAVRIRRLQGTEAAPGTAEYEALLAERDERVAGLKGRVEWLASGNLRKHERVKELNGRVGELEEEVQGLRVRSGAEDVGEADAVDEGGAVDEMDAVGEVEELERVVEKKGKTTKRDTAKGKATKATKTKATKAKATKDKNARGKVTKPKTKKIVESKRVLRSSGEEKAHQFLDKKGKKVRGYFSYTDLI